MGHRREPDLTPSIRSWFAASGFAELSFDTPAGTQFGVGVARFVDAPVTLFAFVDQAGSPSGCSGGSPPG